jgi:hypothetical protein
MMQVHAVISFGSQNGETIFWNMLKQLQWHIHACPFELIYQQLGKISSVPSLYLCAQCQVALQFP